MYSHLWTSNFSFIPPDTDLWLLCIQWPQLLSTAKVQSFLFLSTVDTGEINPKTWCWAYLYSLHTLCVQSEVTVWPISAINNHKCKEQQPSTG